MTVMIANVIVELICVVLEFILCATENQLICKMYMGYWAPERIVQFFNKFF